MLKIICPNCKHEIEIGKDQYNALLNDIEKEEIEKRLNVQIQQIEAKYKAEYALEATKLKANKDNEVSELRKTIALLEEKLKAADTGTQLAVSKALESAKEEISKKEQEIAQLKGDISASKKDSELTAQQLKEKYEFMLQAKDEEIQRYKDFRMGDSTKDLGESLEQYCHDAFDAIRAVAYPRAYFEKDNEVDEEGKGDFIFRDYDEDGTEFVSIMFEMKNQKDTTKTKHKNEHFFEKLDKNRTSKGCEYAVLVSTLEEDSQLYNNGIVDVSYRYPKMFVVRPQHFTAIIGLIKTLSINNLKYRKQVELYVNQNVDINNFEEAVQAIGKKINDDYAKANAIYGDVDKMCDDIIKKVETFRKQFKVASGHIGAAVNQLPNLEVRKLTKNNPTMKQKFEELEESKKGSN